MNLIARPRVIACIVALAFTSTLCGCGGGGKPDVAALQSWRADVLKPTSARLSDTIDQFGNSIEQGHLYDGTETYCTSMRDIGAEALKQRKGPDEVAQRDWDAGVKALSEVNKTSCSASVSAAMDRLSSAEERVDKLINES